MRMLLILALWLTGSVAAYGQAAKLTPAKLTLDWVFDGNTAYTHQAVDKGYFAAEGLDLTIERGFGAAGVPLLVANGGFQFGLSDVSALIEYNSRNPGKPLIGFMMIYDKAAYSVITIADRNIKSFKDLLGRKIGSFTNDTAGRFLPIIAKANGVELSNLKVQLVNIQVRDSLLRAGEVDAVTGFASTATMNLIALGVPEKDVRVFKFSDYGLDIYGSAIITTAEYAKANPELLRGFARALSRGIQDTIRDPATAVAAVKKRNKLIDESVEQRRLGITVRDTIVTPYTKANGFGDIEPARFAKQIEYVSEVFALPRKPAVGEIFTSEFLPPKAARQVP